jgi:hypothetical protein
MISGAVLKSISATHIGKVFSSTAHFKESLSRRLMTVSKS